MSLLIGVNNVATIRHVVRDLNGDPVTGEAANVTTALFDPAGASSALTVTVTEVGTTGFYDVAVTPNSTGLWLLRVTNPDPLTADGTTTDYVLDVQAAAAVAAAAGNNLTTRARVKERMGIATADTNMDDVIDSLISEVSNRMQDLAGRIIPEGTYTEYYDGNDSDMLWLRQGPLVSVTSVESVQYSGTTSRTETLTTVNEGDFVELGLRSENWTMRAGLRLLGGTWVGGRRNYKVVYVAGWSTVPEGLVHVATNWVVARLLTRRASGLDLSSQGDSTIDPVSLPEAEDAIASAIRPYEFLGSYL